MIGIDTNVLVRYLAQDDPRQSAAATRFVEGLSGQSPGFISLVVLAETCWVLQSNYSATSAELADTIDDMLAMSSFHLQQRDVVKAVVAAVRAVSGSKVGVVDLLIAELARDEGCSQTVTFDKNAAKAAGMTLLN